MNQIESDLNGKSKNQTKKLIILWIAGISVLTTAYVLNSKLTKTNYPEVLQSTSASGSLLLSPENTTVNVNDSISLSVSIDTGTVEVSGTDILMQYDPNKLQVTEIIPNTQTSLETFSPVVSEVSPTFDWQKAVNQTQSQIEFSALAYNVDPDGNGDFSDGAPNPYFIGSSNLANINLQAQPVRKNTTIQVSLISELGNTTDSNVVAANEGSDILGTTNTSTIKIMAEPVCRAALDLSDNYPGLNDLLYITTKGWGSSCPDCDEDLDQSSNIGLGDLMYVVGFWGVECPVYD